MSAHNNQQSYDNFVPVNALIVVSNNMYACNILFTQIIKSYVRFLIILNLIINLIIAHSKFTKSRYFPIHRSITYYMYIYPMIIQIKSIENRGENMSFSKNQNLNALLFLSF